MEIFSAINLEVKTLDYYSGKCALEGTQPDIFLFLSLISFQSIYLNWSLSQVLVVLLECIDLEIFSAINLEVKTLDYYSGKCALEGTQPDIFLFLSLISLNANSKLYVTYPKSLRYLQNLSRAVLETVYRATGYLTYNVSKLNFSFLSKILEGGPRNH